MATKMAVAFANLFMAETETKMLSESKIKPKVWKRYIDDVFSLWDVSRKDIDLFIELEVIIDYTPGQLLSKTGQLATATCQR